MTGRNLWYVRSGGKVTGPFPAQVITNHALLGRINPDDEVSQDRLVWQPLVEVNELLPHELLELHTEADPEQRQWLEERLKAARRWADERTHEDRRLHEESAKNGERAGEERRKAQTDPDELALPHHHASPPRMQVRWTHFALGLVVVAILFALAVFYFQPVNPVKVGVIPSQPQCTHPAAPRVNWSGCDMGAKRLRGSDLSGSDLSYADFTRADLSGSRLRGVKLVGTNLNETDLNHTDLSNADLSNADLRGANLVAATTTGAVFDHAIWTDGRVCEVGSTGQCR